MIDIDLPIVIILAVFIIFSGIIVLVFLHSTSKKDKEIERLKGEIVSLHYEDNHLKKEYQSKKSYQGMETSLISEQLKKIEHLENELERQRDKVENAKEIAQEAVKVKYDFLSKVKDDLKSPVKTIIAYATILAKDLQNEKLNSHAKDILTSGNQLLELIESMMALSKIDAGSYDINENAVELSFLFNTIVDSYKNSAAKKKIKLTLDIDKTLPESLIFDASKIKLIVDNLVSNSIRATKDGNVNVYVKPNGANIAHNTINLQVIVEDSGTGIKKEDQPKIFEMFEADGLGLSLNKKIAQLMNGDLTFYSEYGKGATFILSLNDIEVVLPSAEHENHDLEINFAQISPDGANILVIDSDHDSAQVIMESFLESHVRVLHFETPRDAIEELKRSKFDMILIDIEVLTSDENAISKVLAKISDAPVVTLTHSSVKDAHISENGARVVGHLKKPLSKRELFKISLKVLNFPDLLKNSV
ncbi:ATP-binding response regulator [Sulfurimonas marina]|uniref:histidine kinase n=1 Tax=Sulfurimonas marina TaxID=2590551 RepID=A0A7M1AVE3_9BACT|nr:hybrid sensor histidine kinase/response regulator [Sulfurimonas marina]QOP41409.1 hybrid sensor histidine kinase/response regulator [Sulfurimonas marina]